MYTVRKSIQWLADETHVKEQCGSYVTKPGLCHAHLFSLTFSQRSSRAQDTRLAQAASSLLNTETWKNDF